MLISIFGIYGGKNVTANVASTQPKPTGDDWNTSVGSSKMDDSKRITLALFSTEPVEVWLKKVRPTLLVRCLEGKPDVIVETRTAATPELGNYKGATVRLRLDKAKPFRENWSEATNNEALFAPNPRRLIKQLQQTETMVFEFTPFNAGTTSVQFNVKGLDKHLTEFKSICKI